MAKNKSRSPNRVVVALTMQEAQSLQYAAGNSTDSQDDAKALFGSDRAGMEAAYRAQSKLLKAIVRARREAGGNSVGS